MKGWLATIAFFAVFWIAPMSFGLPKWAITIVVVVGVVLDLRLISFV